MAAKRLRDEVEANSVKAGFVVIVWDDKDGIPGRQRVRQVAKDVIAVKHIYELSCVDLVFPHSAIETNKSRLRDGKHILSNVLEDLLGGAPVSENTAIEKIMAATRQFTAHTQAIAMMASSSQGNFVYLMCVLYYICPILFVSFFPSFFTSIVLLQNTLTCTISLVKCGFGSCSRCA